MNSLLIQKRLLLIIAGGGIIVVIILLAFALSLFAPSTTNQTTQLPYAPSPTIVGYQKKSPQDLRSDPQFKNNPKKVESDPTYISTSAEIDIKNKEELAKRAAVGRLLTKLPYQGTLFSMRYDYTSNMFYVALTKSNQVQSNQEFDLFLKNNGVDSETWVTPLTKLYQ